MRTENACHKILIKSKDTVFNETEEADDSIIIIGQNKTTFLETITFCLIEHIQIVKEWLKYREAEHYTRSRLTSDVVGILMVMLTNKALENSKEKLMCYSNKTVN